VLSALLGGAQVAQATARGDTAAAIRAAEQATAFAGTAVTHVQQLQAITAQLQRGRHQQLLCLGPAAKGPAGLC